MNEEAQPMPPEPDPRAAAVQRVADCERELTFRRDEHGRATARLDRAKAELAEARAAAADLLGVRESDLVGLR